MICTMCLNEMKEVHELGGKLIAYYCMKCGARKEVELVDRHKDDS